MLLWAFLFQIRCVLREAASRPSSCSPCDAVGFWSHATTLRRNDGIVRGVVASLREVIYAALLYLLWAFVVQKSFTFAKERWGVYGWHFVLFVASRRLADGRYRAKGAHQRIRLGGCGGGKMECQRGASLARKDYKGLLPDSERTQSYFMTKCK